MTSTRVHRAHRIVALFVALIMVTTGMPLVSSATDINTKEIKVSGESATLTVPELAENEDLAKGYIEEQFYGKASEETEGKVQAASRKPMLNEMEQKAYDILTARIQAIAAGDEDSTEITIPFEDTGFQMKYTADELGVETILGSDGEFTEEANAALDAKLAEINLDKILDAVLIDLPYDLYWFDKAKGTSRGYNEFNIGYQSDGTTESIILDSEAAFLYDMPVAKAYSASGEAGTYVTDTEKTAAPKAAAAKAKAIVDKYKDLSDANKLDAYRNEIIALTDYNDDAAALENPDYGDPWQLVYVFDENPNTTVVCEGYAKAFKYLCDISEFEDTSIECDLVTGDMYSDGDLANLEEGESFVPEPHMWNIVRIGGKNYHVDITNSDIVNSDGTTEEGFPQNDELFLAGGELYESDDMEYRFTWKTTHEGQEYNHFIHYIYDQDTLSNFTEAELTLATTGYNEEQNNVERAQEVLDMINDLPAPDDITLDDKEQVDAAKEAFDSLTSTQQGILDALDEAAVDKLDTALGAIADLAEKKATDDIAEAQRAYDDFLTAKMAVDDAKDEYDALAKEAKEAKDIADASKAAADKAAKTPGPEAIAAAEKALADAQTAAEKAEAARIAAEQVEQDYANLFYNEALTAMNKGEAARTSAAMASVEKQTQANELNEEVKKDGNKVFSDANAATTEKNDAIARQTAADNAVTAAEKAVAKAIEDAEKPIEKQTITLAKPTITNTLANTPKKQNTVIWSKSANATGYELSWKERTTSKWTIKTVGNVAKAPATGHKVRGLYEYRVRAKAAETDTTKAATSAYSNTVYRYFFTIQGIRLTGQKNAIKVQWNKDAQSTGYQILYSTKSNGAGAKVISVGKNSQVSKTITGLKKGQTYYVQLRAYKKVGGKAYIGNITNPKAVKVK